ncbi:MAG: DNA internalization-related competence protein ComEC/Rec2 [Anaerolineae bacterium]|nr:DNA internalization-related competence protein ComEC/Rec2 [Gemmatimonadaceae bacterium]
MPLVAIALTAYAAGLLLGFGGDFALGAAAAVICFAMGAGRRDATLAATGCLCVAGMLTAAAHVAAERDCRTRILSAGEWRVTLLGRATEGAYVRGIVRYAECSLPVAISVESGNASAGEVVTARGTGATARRGLLMQRAMIVVTGEKNWMVRARERAGQAIDRTFRADAPLVRALLIADMSSVSPDVREKFASAGLVHMLSISGLHVAIIALAAELLLQACRIPRVVATISAVVVTAAYVAIIGAPSPAVRAGAMLFVGAVCKLAGRPTSPWASLAVGAWVPLLIDARAVTDLGYQLSVVGIAGLIASGALAAKWLSPRMEGMRLSLASVLLASTVATVVSAPLVTWHFGRLSLVAPLTNLVATPLIAVAQPALFLALLLAPLAPLAAFVADAAHPLLATFDRIATVGAALPLASVTVAPTLTSAVLAGIASGAIVVACISYYPARAMIVVGAALVLAVWIPAAPTPGGDAELHLIDVGQGDAVAFRTPRGRWLLFDAGRSWRGGDDGQRVIIPYLRRRGGDLAAFVLSHPHSDHMGGAEAVLRSLRPGVFWDGAYLAASAQYSQSLSEADRLGVPWRRVHPDDSLQVDGVTVRFLAPDSAWMRTLTDANEASVVALVRYGSVRFLLVGDAERLEEEWLLLNHAEALRAEVLKVGHHGSNTSTSPAFLAAVRPRLALISVGADNRYGHPSPGVVKALAAAGATVMRTDKLGSVIVRTDGRTIDVTAGAGTWGFSP